MPKKNQITVSPISKHKYLFLDQFDTNQIFCYPRMIEKALHQITITHNLKSQLTVIQINRKNLNAANNSANPIQLQI